MRTIGQGSPLHGDLPRQDPVGASRIGGSLHAPRTRVFDQGRQWLPSLAAPHVASCAASPNTDELRHSHTRRQCVLSHEPWT